MLWRADVDCSGQDVGRGGRRSGLVAGAEQDCGRQDGGDAGERVGEGCEMDKCGGEIARGLGERRVRIERCACVLWAKWRRVVCERNGDALREVETGGCGREIGRHVCSMAMSYANHPRTHASYMYMRHPFRNSRQD
eukprot:211129-Rhodomonas_salina.1